MWRIFYCTTWNQFLPILSDWFPCCGTIRTIYPARLSVTLMGQCIIVTTAFSWRYVGSFYQLTRRSVFITFSSRQTKTAFASNHQHSLCKGILCIHTAAYILSLMTYYPWTLNLHNVPLECTSKCLLTKTSVVNRSFTFFIAHSCLLRPRHILTTYVISLWPELFFLNMCRICWSGPKPHISFKYIVNVCLFPNLPITCPATTITCPDGISQGDCHLHLVCTWSNSVELIF